MILPKEAIEEFKNIYQDEERVLLSDAEAEEKANQIFDLFSDLLSHTKSRNNENSSA